MKPAQPFFRRIQRWSQLTQHRARLMRLSVRLAANARPDASIRPVVFLNASSRLGYLSQNAAFTMLTAMGLQADGVPVIHYACHAGMSRCVQGTDKDDPDRLPPCEMCIAESRRQMEHAPIVWFRYQPDPVLRAAVEPMDLETLSGLTWPFGEGDIPLGALTLESLRWVLRRYDLQDDAPTRRLLREFILSAYSLAQEFDAFLQRVEPSTLVVFNGITYPEATARWVAQRHGVPVITHEVGFQPFSAFFSHGDATAYPLPLPDDFALTPEQDARLDEYLSQRFQGNFSMAGIQFWPQMQSLDPALLGKMAGFRKTVPVFTNVIFDTSQIHANTVFATMFAWLDGLLEIMRSHPEVLFILRAHPDENRPGKQSRQSVAEWVQASGADQLPNLVFVPPDAYLSSYDLIQRASFVLVYNSSIGLEATLLGKPVLSAGRARYTQLPTVTLPHSAAAYWQTLQAFLAASELSVPQEYITNARRFLYAQLYHASLPFDAFIEAADPPGTVRLKAFDWKSLHPDQSSTLGVLRDGIRNYQPFWLPG